VAAARSAFSILCVSKSVPRRPSPHARRCAPTRGRCALCCVHSRRSAALLTACVVALPPQHQWRALSQETLWRARPSVETRA
jgi:hypothetical protein